MDAELGDHARSGGRLRFEIARGLEAMARAGGHHEMGFSSVEAYALERLGRSPSWVQKARRLVRRLGALPLLRAAHLSGRIGASMAALLARVATPDDEGRWLAESERATVRAMTARVAEMTSLPGDAVSLDSLEPECALRTLIITVPREDAWLFEGARLLAKHLGEPTLADACDAIVAEGAGTLFQGVPGEAVVAEDDPEECRREAQRAWERELARTRIAAEELCESRMRARPGSPCSLPGVGTVVSNAEPRRSSKHERASCERDWSDPSPLHIDAALRALAAELAVRDLAVGELLEIFFCADGWRRLGYATAAHYARERLGTSLSSIKDRRQLVRRVRRLPVLVRAIHRGELGYESLRLVAGVATPRTVEAWLDRARARSVRHLREEIDAAELAARLANQGVVLPPSEELLEVMADFERRLIAGQTFPSPDPSADAAAAACEGVGAVSRKDARGRVTLRLRMRDGTARDYRRLEAIFLRHRRPGSRVTFLRFLSLAFIETWRRPHPDVAYSHVYERDRYRCQSPVCARRDVTPHHLRFRSRGGDDSDENVTSLCAWCHLEGVHGGRIAAAPLAREVRWTLGRTGHTIVEGRELRRVTRVG